MANEIKIGINFSVTKAGATYTRNESFTDTLAGNSWVTGVQYVGANSEVIITHEDIVNYGWIYLKNLGEDESRYVDFAHGTAAIDGGDNVCRLYGGESCIFKMSSSGASAASGTALNAISNESSQKVEYAIIEL